jgi:drug/metabolite transporter (DMT)-like permease
MSEVIIGTLSLFGAAFLYGSQNVATRLTGISFGPFLSTALRALIVVVFLAGFVKWKKISQKDWKWFALRAVGNVIATTCIFISVNKMSVGAALFSFYASLILSGGLFGMLFYKEKITLVKTISLFLTAVGLVLIYSNQSKLTFNWYFVIAIIGGIGGSLWSVFSRPITKNYSLKQLVVVDSGITVLLSLLISLSLHESWQMVQFDQRLLAVLYLGFTQVFTGQLVAKGFKSIDAQVGSMILLNDSIFGIIFAFLFFKEITPLLVILGGTFVFLSSILPIIASQKKTS